MRPITTTFSTVSPTSQRVLATLLDMTQDAHPGPGRRADRSDRAAAGGGCGRLHVRWRRSRPPDRRPPRAGRDADRDRPRSDRRGALRRDLRRGPLPHTVHPRRLRQRPVAAPGGGAARRPRVPRPRHVLDAGRHLGARFLLRLRRAAGHAHGPRRRADRAGDRQHLGRAPAGAPAARVRRGALRLPDRPGDRPRTSPPGAQLHPPARRGDQVGGPGSRAVRRRPPGPAHVPGAADRRQRRARPARRGAARSPGTCCAPTAGSPRSRSTRSRIAA